MDIDCREQILGEDYADLIVEYSQLSDLEAYGYCYSIIDKNFATIHVPLDELPSNFLQVFGFSSNPLCFGLMDIPSTEASGISALRNIPVLNLRGQGVLIGIVDTGIDYTHEAFIQADGTSRILSIWDQTIQDGPPPDGFNIGTVYTREQINAALEDNDPFSLVPTRDEDGHGTFLAGIAAGNRNDQANFSGIATDAEIVVVKLKKAKAYLKEFYRIPPLADAYQGNDIMLAVSYLLNVAAQTQKPISICIGLGSSQGAHDNYGIMGLFFNDVARRNGVAVSVAAGNEGNRRNHFSGQVTRAQESDTVELRVGPNEYGFTMELWGNTPNIFSIDILSPTGEYIPRIPARLNESREIRFILEETIVNIDYFLIAAESGDQLILLRFLKPTEGIWRFRIYSSGDYNLGYNIWLPIHLFISDDTYFTTPDPDTTVTTPGNTILPMTVTAYDVSNDSLFINASRGFTRMGDIKPDFAAPGVNLVGPAPNNRYVTMSGTSVAAAHNTGISALLLEWGITLGFFRQMSTIEIKNFLIKGAVRDPLTDYPNKAWGYGRLNIYNSFLRLRGDLL